MRDTLELEYELLRRLSPAKKLAIMQGLIREAWALKEAWVRHCEPDLPEDAVRARVREAMARGRP